MSNLTSGEMFYERRVTTGQYEHKMFSARIFWNTSEGEPVTAAQDIMNAAANEATRIVHERLGLAQPAVNGGVVDLAATAAVQKAQAIMDAPANLPKKQKKAADPTPPTVEPSTPTVAADDELLGPTNQADPSPSIDAPSGGVADPLAELEALNKPAEISNEDLTAAVHKKFGAGATDADRAKFPAFKLGLPKFAPQISAIVQEKRGEFLEWLASL